MPAYFGRIGEFINQELPRLTTGAAKTQKLLWRKLF